MVAAIEVEEFLSLLFLLFLLFSTTVYNIIIPKTSYFVTKLIFYASIKQRLMQTFPFLLDVQTRVNRVVVRVHVLPFSVPYILRLFATTERVGLLKSCQSTFLGGLCVWRHNNMSCHYIRGISFIVTNNFKSLNKSIERCLMNAMYLTACMALQYILEMVSRH